MRHVLIVLNERAGTLLDRDPLAVKAELRRRLARPGRTVDVLLAHKRGIGRAIDRGAASDYDTIIVGGGDGSVGHAANRLAGTGKTLGVLPLGTVNLFARDIGVPSALDDAISAVEASVPRAIDLGMLNGRAFHTLSGMGFFSQMARAREQTRDLPGKALRVMAAAARAFSRAGRFTLDLSIDGRKRHIDSVAVLVTVNRFSGEEWRRASRCSLRWGMCGATEDPMHAIVRMSRWLMALALAWMVGTVPACGTMGGGGMKYLTDSPAAASDT